MDKLHCEACGSNELIKKGDSFVCNYCNTAYLIKGTNNATVVNETETSTIKTSAKNRKKIEKENREAEEPKLPVPVWKKTLSLLLMLLGLFFLFGAMLTSRTKDTAFFGLFSWWSVLLLNISYTMAYGKKVLLTKKFNGWQLTVITIIIFLAMALII